MAMMKRYMEMYRELGNELSRAYTEMERDELVGRFLALRLRHDDRSEHDVMLHYSALKEILRDPQFLEHEAPGDHDPEAVLRAFVDEAGMDDADA